MLDIQRQKPKKPAQLHMFVASFFSFHLFVVQMFLCLKNLYKLYYILYFIVTLLMFALVLNSFKKTKTNQKTYIDTWAMYYPYWNLYTSDILNSLMYIEYDTIRKSSVNGSVSDRVWSWFVKLLMW